MRILYSFLVAITFAAPALACSEHETPKHSETSPTVAGETVLQASDCDSH